MYYLGITSNIEDFYYECMYQEKSESFDKLLSLANEMIHSDVNIMKQYCFSSEGDFRWYLPGCSSEGVIVDGDKDEFVECYLLLMIGEDDSVYDGYCGNGLTIYRLDYVINYPGEIVFEEWEMVDYENE